MSVDHAKYYAKQISLTEWLESIGHKDTAAIRVEDNEKRERLGVLGKIIDLPYDKPHQFTGVALARRTPEFKQFMKQHGDELCAIRLIPLKPDVPKLRMRGKSIKEAVDWFDNQKIDPANYRVDFVPHDTSEWASIFVINKQGIFGDLTRGPHNELTQGHHTDHEPITFAYDFEKWKLSKAINGAEQHLNELVKYLSVKDPAIQERLKADLSATFSHDFLEGYYETTASRENGVWFKDYSRIIGKMYAGYSESPTPRQSALVTGRTGSAGKVTGIVRQVHENEIGTAHLRPDEILVCSMTTPDFVPLMQQAAAIVTDLGGILSHAAIVARELKKPCITGTKNATQVLVDGMTVSVDADAGTVVAA